MLTQPLAGPGAPATKYEGVEHWRAYLTAQESLPECFEQIAASYPTRTALGSDTWRPTYAELNAVANRWAYRLLRRGISAGDRVAVLMQHDTPLVAAKLSVLKAGGIVVVVSPTDPPGRLRQVIQDAEPQLVLTDRQTSPLAEEAFGAVPAIAEFDHRVEEGPDCNPGICASPDDTAMLCYTSGSTGQPKALMMSRLRPQSAESPVWLSG
jgi:non-ribosomal peptide synthetase component F